MSLPPQENLDAALEPLLLQQKFKQGGTEMIKVQYPGDTDFLPSKKL